MSTIKLNNNVSMENLLKYKNNKLSNSYEPVIKDKDKETVDNTSRCSQQTLKGGFTNATIPYRLLRIKELLGECEVKPIFDPYNTDTENFVGVTNYLSKKKSSLVQ